MRTKNKVPKILRMLPRVQTWLPIATCQSTKESHIMVEKRRSVTRLWRNITNNYLKGSENLTLTIIMKKVVAINKIKKIYSNLLSTSRTRTAVTR